MHRSSETIGAIAGALARLAPPPERVAGLFIGAQVAYFHP